jgi:hypothetical protein
MSHIDVGFRPKVVLTLFLHHLEDIRDGRGRCDATLGVFHDAM